MTTTKSRASVNGQAETAQAQENPLLTNKQPTTDWKAKAQQFDQEAKFWKMKYFEQMQHSQQVIAMLARPQLEQDAQAQSAELMSRLAALGKAHE